MYKKNLTKKIIVLLVFSILITSCTLDNESNTISSLENLLDEADDLTYEIIPKLHIQEIQRFDDFTNKLFLDYLSSSPLEMSLLISSSEKFGLSDLSGQLDDFSDESLLLSYAKTKKSLDELIEIDRSALTTQQQLSYDIIKYYLEIHLEGEKYYDLSYNLQHTLGFHISLPLTLTQIPIENKEDALNYLSRLEQFPNAIDQLISSERQKALSGLLQPEYISDKVIKQCQAFMTELETNILYLSFFDYLESLDTLTTEEKATLKERCLYIIKTAIYPSYELLIETLLEIKSLSIVTAGIHVLPKGKDYYSYLVRYHTGTNITPEELRAWAIETLVEASTRMNALIYNNPDIMDTEVFSVDAYEDFETLYAKCMQITKDNFYDYNIPPINTKIIPTYLEKDLPSAFYLPLSIDMNRYGNMFIQKSLYDNLDTEAFLIISHESIPGHHFQNSVAYSGSEIPNIRKAIAFSCYSEGWASYVESIAVNYIQYNNPIVNRLMLYNLDITYALLTLIDISIHYLGISKDDIIMQYAPYFSEENISEVIDRSVANPAETIHYAYGRYFINNLRNLAEEKLGDAFNIKEFHDVILRNGEVPLFLLEKIVKLWLNE